ncbi:APC family permease [Salinigranum salinum]|uniref:APC family permease n=1 Tax=Salinigranum salinum TaxID=1364937 RepID=UPI0012611CC3|nr:APC family permease [Salinigranum salinum]
MSELRRELGLVEAVVYGVGLILGAGIYAILGEATGVTGGSIVVSFLLAALIASLTGLSYAELASLFPKAEGDYIYVREAFNREVVSDLTAVGRLSMGVISTAAVALAFSGYLSAFVSLPTVPIAVLLIAGMACVNFWGIELSTRVNVVFTGIEVAGLLIIIWIGSGSWGNTAVAHTPNGLFGVVHASFLIFFAYLGFGSIVNLSEETEDATVTIPRAVVLSIGITTVLYVLVGLSAVALVDWRVLGRSASPLAEVALAGWGPFGSTLLAVIALFSTTNTVLILQISTSRLLYGVSKSEYHVFPQVLSRIHPSRQTPHYAVALVGLLTIPFVFLGDIGLVAGLANLMLLFVFVLVNGALLKLRFSRPHAERGFRTPLNIGRVSLTAVAGLLSSIGLIVFYITTW